MSGSTALPEAPAVGDPIQHFLGLTKKWLTAPDRGDARRLIVMMLALTGVQVGIQILFNLWNRDFFNALENRDGAAFQAQIIKFFVLAAASMATAVYQLYLKQLIQLRWRGWLTKHLLDNWLRDGRQYQLEMTGQGADNPDQRIADDVRLACDLAVHFVTGVLTSVLMLTAFVGILWTLSGALQLTIAGKDIAIPGYMVWAALFYALIGTTLTWLVGRPMVRLNVERMSAEGDFRFGLSRARESGEGIAFIRGEEDERRGLGAAFDKVAVAVRKLMSSQRNLMWLTSAYGTLAMIFPTIVASPGYFAGVITLGGLMQIGAAFGQVQSALNWFVDNFPQIAEWRSAITRLMTFQMAVDDLAVLAKDPDQPTISVTEGAPDLLVFRDLEVAFVNGTTVIAEASAEIRAGDRVLIKGASGTGKSTLFRAIGGLWPWGAGEIVTPPAETMMFMPQRPYLPLGTLHAALSYPAPEDRFPAADAAIALELVGLKHLTERLSEEERWDRVLSLGEQQRMAFARLLLHRPAWIFMDEATAALDEENQDAMMNLVLEHMPDCALISIGHRPGLEVFHNRTLTLHRQEEGGARVALPPRRPQPAKRWIRSAIKSRLGLTRSGPR